MNLSDEAQGNELLYANFNQDQGCFATGTQSGFVIYNTSPFRETFRRIFSIGGIGIVEMLYRCNILALVGGGRNPRYPPSQVMIWDDHQNRCIGEMIFKPEIRAVRLRRDRIVVVLERKVYVYRFADLHRLSSYTTVPNPKGLVALSPDSSNAVLACPGCHKGHVHLDLFDQSKSLDIIAHETELAQIALNLDGTRLASASEKGTLIRVFDTSSGATLHELRRGMDRAEIYSICFNQTSTFLACTSDKGTAHIFSLDGAHAAGDGRGGAAGDGRGGGGAGGGAQHMPPPDEVMEEGKADGTGGNVQNTRSGLAFMRGIIPGSFTKYLGSEWSYAQVRGLESKCICAFGPEPFTLAVVCADGTFLMSSFEQGGECTRISYAKFMRNDEDDEALAWMGDQNTSNAAAAQGGADEPPPPAPEGAGSATDSSAQQQQGGAGAGAAAAATDPQQQPSQAMPPPAGGADASGDGLGGDVAR